MIRRSALLALLLLLPACDADGDVPGLRAYPLVTDSAGVRVVTNGPLDDAPSCGLAPAPEVTVGDRTGAEGHDLYRVFGASRLADGRIVVVDQGSQQLRFFSGDGDLLTTAGRSGEGPGEFTDAFLLYKLPGDTLWVGDYRPWAFEVFDASGEWVRGVPLRPTFLNTPEAGGVLEDGRTIFAERVNPTPGNFEPSELRILMYDRDGALIDTLGVVETRRMGQTDDDPSSVYMAPWFEASFEMDVGGERLVRGHGRTPELVVQLVGAVPQTELVIRWAEEDRDVTSGDIEAARAAMRERYPDLDPDMQRRLVGPLVDASRPAADVFPAFTAVSIGDVEAIWVRRYRRTETEAPAEWARFSPDGVLEGVLALPGDADVQEFGSGYVLLLEQDDLGTESVSLYRWSGPDGGP